MKKAFQYIILFLSFIFTSCMNDDLIEPKSFNESSKGLFIINEGNFTYSNSSLSYLNLEENKIRNDVFFSANGIPLGDVAQSMTINDSLGYIVINNSGKINIINTSTFELVGKITGLVSPRSIHFINDHKAYVSDLYARAITIVDPSEKVITGNINLNNAGEFLQHSSEFFLEHNNYIYVNCWSYDNTILKIDPIIDEVVDSIKVTSQPNSMVIDKVGKMWVLSDGGFDGSSYDHTMASLTKINLETFDKEAVLYFNDINASPSNLKINETRDVLYYIYGGSGGSQIAESGIYEMNITAIEINQKLVIPGVGKNFNGLHLLDDRLYVHDAKNYLSQGSTLEYDQNYSLRNEYKVGIIPSNFCNK